MEDINEKIASLRNGGKIREFPTAKNEAKIESKTTNLVANSEQTAVAQKQVVELPVMGLHFVDFNNGVRIPFCIEAGTKDLDTWARNLPTFTLQGVLLNGSMVVKTTFVGPVLIADHNVIQVSQIVTPTAAEISSLTKK